MLTQAYPDIEYDGILTLEQIKDKNSKRHNLSDSQSSEPPKSPIKKPKRKYTKKAKQIFVNTTPEILKSESHNSKLKMAQEKKIRQLQQETTEQLKDIHEIMSADLSTIPQSQASCLKPMCEDFPYSATILEAQQLHDQTHYPHKQINPSPKATEIHPQQVRFNLDNNQPSTSHAVSRNGQYGAGMPATSVNRDSNLSANAAYETNPVPQQTSLYQGQGSLNQMPPVYNQVTQQPTGNYSQDPNQGTIRRNETVEGKLFSHYHPTPPESSVTNFRYEACLNGPAPVILNFAPTASKVTIRENMPIVLIWLSNNLNISVVEKSFVTKDGNTRTYKALVLSKVYKDKVTNEMKKYTFDLSMSQFPALFQAINEINKRFDV